ncbi:LamB/YcsF family protein [Adhaeribacter radiodurans]|uniref:5-oxoprolinase subunit A n=1 Tax=Adhaeribacter radiodurans TaxID=2745197 RepID=A0A7L7LB26_9BACT|nr:5-oxoprolinase subunit PxpA [Adhaeribacter radiodurans]QMU29963.1 LamB/YcsF family protein [Adhaeribacter radiodurans]
MRNPTLTIDLNCDVGESFGVYQLGNDEAILPYVSSVNIACGFHAGDPAVMKQTVNLALQHGVAIGAHPGLPDLVGFGRREIIVSPEEAYDMVVYQVGALAGFVKAAGGTLHHVKPHGALYNMAAVNLPLAQAIAEAVHKVNPEAFLYGLAGSALIQAGEQFGLLTANEVFSDRTYQPNGTLTPRRQPNALITEEQVALNQVIQMVKSNTVRAQNGSDIPIKADTICIHGDGAHAAAFAKKINETLQQEKIQIRAATYNRIV